tara:strand:+ start:4464 stop:4685 length:222 start_codon:yes stop_codon:yes gene_type:complete
MAMDSEQVKNLGTTGARRFLKAEFGRIGGSEVPLAYCTAKLAELERQIVELELRLAASTKPASKPAAKTAKKK